EFSTATTPRSARPLSTSANTSAIVDDERYSAAAPNCWRAARCAYVAAGPRYAIVRLFSRLRDAEMISRKIARTDGAGSGPGFARVSRTSTPFSRPGAYTVEFVRAFCSAIASARSARWFRSRRSWSSIRSMCRRSAEIEALRGMRRSARGLTRAPRFCNVRPRDERRADGSVARVATARERRARASHERREMPREDAAEDRRGATRIAVRAARGFAHDLVDDAHRREVRGGQAEELGRARDGIVAAAPVEDRRGALRPDHGVPRMLLHDDAVRDGQRERAAAAALADHGGEDRYAEPCERRAAPRDRLRLAALLGADAGIRALRVDEREDRQREPLGELEEANRLPEPFRTRHAEVPLDRLRGIASPLVPDDDDRSAREAREPADDRRIVGEQPIAVELREAVAEPGDVVERRRPVGMARELDPFPRREPGHARRG